MGTCELEFQKLQLGYFVHQGAVTLGIVGRMGHLFDKARGSLAQPEIPTCKNSRQPNAHLDISSAPRPYLGPLGPLGLPLLPPTNWT